MQAVILAAGRGARMRSMSATKPMIALLGMPLIERTVCTAQSCGIENIIIVTGSEPCAIEAWQQAYTCAHPHVQITLVHNDKWDSSENGQSLAAAAPHIRRDFLLLMADHVYAPELLASLCKMALPPGCAALAVDGDIHRQDIDPDDVTHVHMKSQHIVRIGKGLHPHNGFDTGAFLCSAAVAERAVEQCGQGRTRLSDTMQALADDGQLLAHRVDGLYWQDIDTPQAHEQAEEGLLRWAAGKAADGAVAKYVNRPVSKRITRVLIHTGITPNQTSLLAFGIAVLAALCLAQPHYWGLLAGGLLVQLASIVDGCDGELARLRLRPSPYGGWFDALLDRYADAAILAGLTWHLMQLHQQPQWMWLGLLAIAGSFVSSYSAHKADGVLRHSRWRIGRDTRSLLVMTGSVLALPATTLTVIALAMNAVVAVRVVRLRGRDGDNALGT